MKKNELKSAFREAVSEQFSEIPKNEYEIDHTFSEGFEKKMQKLTHTQKTFGRRIFQRAMVFAAVVFLICSGVIVTNAKEYGDEVFLRNTGYGIQVSLRGTDMHEKIESVYELTNLPADYKIREQMIFDNYVLTVYENESLDIFTLGQYVDVGYYFDFDECEYEFYDTWVDDIHVNYYAHIMDSAISYEAYWVQDGYAFCFYTNHQNGERISKEEMAQYVRSVKAISEETQPAEPELTEPQVTEPQLTEPELTEPQVTAEDVTDPEN